MGAAALTKSFGGSPNNMRKHIRSIIVSIIAAALLLGPVIYVQANKWIYANRVTQYLVKKKNYSKAEIQSVKGVWGVKLPAFYVVVTFEEEPDVEYTYYAHDRVLQMGYTLKNGGIPAGPDGAGLRYYEPR